MDSSMVSLQARFSTLLLLRCAGLRFRLFRRAKLDHSPFGRGVKGHCLLPSPCNSFPQWMSCHP